jgi:hypothetical protein
MTGKNKGVKAVLERRNGSILRHLTLGRVASVFASYAAVAIYAVSGSYSSFFCTFHPVPVIGVDDDHAQENRSHESR